MPKDEFDFEDPFELNGMAMPTHEDTTNQMAECFIEEFMRMGYNHKQVLALFRNPHYLGPNMVLEKRGEPFVRNTIAEVFARWGRPVSWLCSTENPLTPALSPSDGERVDRRQSVGETCAVGNSVECTLLFPLPLGGGQGQGEGEATDPMGSPIPKLNL